MESTSALDRAIYKMVHEYSSGNKKGAEALGPLIDINVGVLCNKVNTNLDTHKLSVGEFIKCLAVTQDVKPLKELNTMFDSVTVPMPTGDPLTAGDLFDICLDWAESTGLSASIMKKIKKDPVVTQEMAEKYKRQSNQSIEMLLKMQQFFEEKAQESGL